MKNIRITVVFIAIVFFGGCEKPFEEDQIIKEPVWKFPYKIDIDDPFVYAAIVDQGLWRKNFRESNSNWEYLNFEDTTYSDGIDGARDVDAHGGEILVASRLEKIWRSLDGGETWSKPEPGFINNDEWLQIYAVARSPKNPKIIYAVDDDRRLFNSMDNGNSWELAYEDNGYIDMYNIRLNPHKPEEIWTFGWGGGPEWRSSFIGLSNFGTQEKVNVNLDSLLGNHYSEWIFDLTFDAVNGEILYAWTTSGFFKSINGGISWVSIGENIQPIKRFSSMIYDPRFENSLFLEKSDSIYYSNDGLESIQFVGKFRENGDKNFGVYLKIIDDLLFISANEGIFTFSIEGIR